MGVISGWEASPFDLRAPWPRGVVTDPKHEVPLTPDGASVLRDIRLLDFESERIVFGARVEFGRITLRATEDGLEELAEYVAAEANHESHHQRQKRLDAALECLSDALEKVGSSTAISPLDDHAPGSDRSTPIAELTRRWRIEESDLWDRDALDLVIPAHIEFRSDGTGSFAFIAVKGWLDCRPATIDGQPGVEFTWEGTDDGDPVSGRGWAAPLDGGRLQLHIYFHMGDDSGFLPRPFVAGSSGSF